MKLRESIYKAQINKLAEPQNSTSYGDEDKPDRN